MRRLSSAARSSARFSSPSSASRASDQTMQRRRRRGLPRRANAGSAAAAIAWQARRLGLRAGALGDFAHVGLEPALGFGEAVSTSRQAISLRQRFVAADVGGEIAVARRLPRLPAQAVDLRVDLLEHVFEAQQIVFGALQPQLGLVAARVQAGDARRLFENEAARLRLGGDDLADLPLPHHRGERAPVEASANSSCTSRARASRPLTR